MDEKNKLLMADDDDGVGQVDDLTTYSTRIIDEGVNE